MSRAVHRLALALAFLALACEGTAPNPRAGYTLKISLGAGFDATRITSMRVILDSLPFGPSLNLQPGPGETVTLGTTQVTSRRTDIDGDGQVEAVFETSGNPFAAATSFDLPLRSPGYATVPFYLRVELLGAAGIIASASVGATPAGKALNFDLGDSVDVPITVDCVAGKSCAGGPSDGGTTDGGTQDGGLVDGGAQDGGATLPGPIAYARDSQGNGVEDVLELYDPRSTQKTILSQGPEIDAFRWTGDGAQIALVREAGAGMAELVLVAPGQSAVVLARGPSLADLTLAPGSAAVRELVDGGVSWLVRSTSGADAGVDLPGQATGALAFTPAGDVVLPVPTADGGVAIARAASGSATLRTLLALTRFVASALSPTGTHVAVVGQRATDTSPTVYVASTGGDPLVRLFLEAAGGQVRDIAFSADGARLGLRGDLNASGVNELFVASPGLTDVSGGIAPGGTGVTQWAFHPIDSSRLLFLGDRRTAGVRELYVATMGLGAPPRRLSGESLDGGVASFGWSRTGGRVAYRTEAGRLHVIRANDAPLDLGDADAFAWSPDEAWLAVVRAGALYLVSADGSQTIGPLATALREKRLGWKPAP